MPSFRGTNEQLNVCQPLLSFKSCRAAQSSYFFRSGLTHEGGVHPLSGVNYTSCDVIYNVANPLCAGCGARTSPFSAAEYVPANRTAAINQANCFIQSAPSFFLIGLFSAHPCSQLDRLNGETFEYVSADAQPVVFLQRRLRDNSKLLGIVNLCLDPLKDVSVRCGKNPAKVEYLSPSGQWRKVQSVWSEPVLRIHSQMECCQCLVLRLSK